LLDSDGHPLSPPFLLELMQNGKCGVMCLLDGEDDLEFRIVLEARAAKVAGQVLFQAMNRFENGHRRPGLLVGGGALGTRVKAKDCQQAKDRIQRSSDYGDETDPP
jgi:hypothetical protein